MADDATTSAAAAQDLAGAQAQPHQQEDQGKSNQCDTALCPRPAVVAPGAP